MPSGKRGAGECIKRQGPGVRNVSVSIDGFLSLLFAFKRLGKPVLLINVRLV